MPKVSAVAGCTSRAPSRWQAPALLNVLAALLSERKIVLHSVTADLLAPVAEGLTMLMYPFQWQCLYIPVLPVTIALDCIEVRYGRLAARATAAPGTAAARCLSREHRTYQVLRPDAGRTRRPLYPSCMAC